MSSPSSYELEYQVTELLAALAGEDVTVPTKTYEMKLEQIRLLELLRANLGPALPVPNDSGAAIQTALDEAAASGRRYVTLAGTYTVPPLSVPSGVSIVSRGARLVLAPNAPLGSAVVKFDGVSRAGIIGHLEVDGNRLNQNVADPNAGQAGVDVIRGAQGITIDSLRAVGCTRDGLYLGGSAPVRGVRIGRVVADDSGRNGVSVTNASDVVIDYLEARNTRAGVTGDGVDFEPNNVGDALSAISVGTLIARNNARNGVQVFGRTVLHGGISIGVLESYQNGGDGLVLYVCSRINVASGNLWGNGLNGLRIPRDCRNIRVRADIFGNAQRGISGALTVQTLKSGLWDFTGCRLYNNSQAAPNVSDGARFDSDADAFPLERVLLRSAALYDDQAVPTQRNGVTTGAVGRVDRVRVEAFVYGNVAGNGFVNGANSSYNSL